MFGSDIEAGGAGAYAKFTIDKAISDSVDFAEMGWDESMTVREAESSGLEECRVHIEGSGEGEDEIIWKLNGGAGADFDIAGVADVVGVALDADCGVCGQGGEGPGLIGAIKAGGEFLVGYGNGQGAIFGGADGSVVVKMIIGVEDNDSGAINAGVLIDGEAASGPNAAALKDDLSAVFKRGIFERNSSEEIAFGGDGWDDESGVVSGVTNGIRSDDFQSGGRDGFPDGEGEAVGIDAHAIGDEETVEGDICVEVHIGIFGIHAGAHEGDVTHTVGNSVGPV